MLAVMLGLEVCFLNARRVAWPCTSGTLVEVRAQALDDIRADVLAEFYDAAVEVSGDSPANLGRAFAFGASTSSA